MYAMGISFGGVQPIDHSFDTTACVFANRGWENIKSHKCKKQKTKKQIAMIFNNVTFSTLAQVFCRLDWPSIASLLGNFKICFTKTSQFQRMYYMSKDNALYHL